MIPIPNPCPRCGGAPELHVFSNKDPCLRCGRCLQDGHGNRLAFVTHIVRLRPVDLERSMTEVVRRWNAGEFQ